MRYSKKKGGVRYFFQDLNNNQGGHAGPGPNNPNANNNLNNAELQAALLASMNNHVQPIQINNQGPMGNQVPMANQGAAIGYNQGVLGAENNQMRRALQASMRNQQVYEEEELAKILKQSEDMYEEQRKQEEQRLSEERERQRLAREEFRRQQEKEYQESLAANIKKAEEKRLAKEAKNKANKIAKEAKNKANKIAKEAKAERNALEAETEEQKRAKRVKALAERYEKLKSKVGENSNSDEFFSANEGNNNANNANNNVSANNVETEYLTYFIKEYEKELGRIATKDEKQRIREKYF